MAVSNYDSMDVSDLGDNAAEADLAWFRLACRARQGETGEDAAAVTAWMWGDGDWPTRARRYADPSLVVGWQSSNE